MKLGLRGSTELTRKFANAEGFGVVLGSRSGLAVVDVDTKDENIVADVLTYYGPSPLIARSPSSGGHHVYYRHNGRQRRRIRDPYWRERGAPVDVLGNGVVVLPPSRSPRGDYAFVQGGLEDLHRLPVLRAGVGEARAERSAAAAVPEPKEAASPLRGMREHDGRNSALFMAIGPVARDIHRACGTRDQLLEIARTHNALCAQPMEEPEVERIVGNVWGMTREGRNVIGEPGAFCLNVEHLEMDSDALKLFAFLRAHQGPHGLFWCTNTLAERFDWDRRRLADARRVLIEQGYLVSVRQAGRGHPALFGGDATEQRERPATGVEPKGWRKMFSLYLLTPLSLLLLRASVRKREATTERKGRGPRTRAIHQRPDHQGTHHAHHHDEARRANRARARARNRGAQPIVPPLRGGRSRRRHLGPERDAGSRSRTGNHRQAAVEYARRARSDWREGQGRVSTTPVVPGDLGREFWFHHYARAPSPPSRRKRRARPLSPILCRMLRRLGEVSASPRSATTTACRSAMPKRGPW